MARQQGKFVCVVPGGTSSPTFAAPFAQLLWGAGNFVRVLLVAKLFHRLHLEAWLAHEEIMRSVSGPLKGRLQLLVPRDWCLDVDTSVHEALASVVPVRAWGSVTELCALEVDGFGEPDVVVALAGSSSRNTVRLALCATTATKVLLVGELKEGEEESATATAKSLHGLPEAIQRRLHQCTWSNAERALVDLGVLPWKATA